MKPK
jgi:hypothetical protein